MQALSVSIGLRTINVANLTVKNCRFAIQDDAAVKLRKFLAAKKGYLFSAGIFASGTFDDAGISNNTFEGAGDFSAGFLHTPAANFIDPNITAAPDNPTRRSPLGDTRLTLAEQRTAAARAVIDSQKVSRTEAESVEMAPQSAGVSQEKKKKAEKTVKASLTTKATAGKRISKRTEHEETTHTIAESQVVPDALNVESSPLTFSKGSTVFSFFAVQSTG